MINLIKLFQKEAELELALAGNAKKFNLDDYIVKMGTIGCGNTCTGTCSNTCDGSCQGYCTGSGCNFLS